MLNHSRTSLYFMLTHFSVRCVYVFKCFCFFITSKSCMTDNHLIDCSLNFPFVLFFGTTPCVQIILRWWRRRRLLHYFFDIFVIRTCSFSSLLLQAVFFSVLCFPNRELSRWNSLAFPGIKVDLNVTTITKLFEELFFFSLIFVHVPINSLIQTPLYFTMVLREVSIIVTI